MRLVTIRPVVGDWTTGAAHRPAVVLPSGRLLPLGALVDVAPTGLPSEIGRMDLAAVLAFDPGLGAVRDAVAAADHDEMEAASLDPGSVRLMAPIPRPGKIVGVGYNYLEHIREQGLERPTRPVLFSMFSNAVTADGDSIRHPAGTHALDLEAELAVVIGRRASRVAVADAVAHVAGYTIANDVTARDWQGQAKALRPGEKGDGQWLRAKGSDTFLPLGPVMVTPDELGGGHGHGGPGDGHGGPGDGHGLAVRSWRTGAAGPDAGRLFQMQDGNTSDLLFGIAELISIISAEVALDPGDVIVTGTPSGVGVFRDPQIFLEPGDVVTVEVEGIGRLTNPITDVEGNAPTGSPAARFMAGRVS
jgi:2-keto-4-pentenoate hydratase/2-oxohepta-3-ene-1,7-dioic acid hydratase in catechol pathway